MIETIHCRQCGAKIPPHAKWGLCPRCVLDPSQDHDMEENENAVADDLFGEGGRCFADYEIGRQIGRGGMGVVYEAVQISLHRPVAFKMILDISHASPLLRRRFAIEAEAAAKLDHPNIVPIYELGQYRGNPFLSMKLVLGESLRERIARGNFCVTEQGSGSSHSSVRQREIQVVKFMVKVARAVHHAHQHGVVHRDLKPANILLDQDEEPYITDFGLAKIVDSIDGISTLSELTVTGGVYGTPGYMPPEQASGQHVSKAADIHSLGAILYELMTGKPPFKADTPLETIKLTMDQSPKRPRSMHPGLDKDLETICLKCLEKNPQARYESAEALAEDLERWLRREPIRARPAGPVLRTGRWISRNPIGTGLILSLFVALTISLMLLHMALLQQELYDKIIKISIIRITRDIQKLWETPDEVFVQIESFDLDNLLGRIPRLPNPNAVNLVFGLSINEEPLGQAMKYAPLLKLLEEQIELSLRQPIFIHLRLYKLERWQMHGALAAGQVDIARLSPLNYAYAKRQNADIEPVVEEIADKKAVIFARKDLELTQLQQIRGRTMVFAHTNSIISFMAKCRLVQSEILGRDLKAYTNLKNPNDVAQALDYDGMALDDEDFSQHNLFAHKEVIQKVLAGEYDIGVARLRDFDRNSDQGAGLKKLDTFDVPGDLHVARSGLSPKLLTAYQTVLLSLTGRNDMKILTNLQGTRVEGFKATSDAKYRTIHVGLTNELMQFEFKDIVPPGARPVDE